jgi:hypothetical protein
MFRATYGLLAVALCLGWALAAFEADSSVTEACLKAGTAAAKGDASSPGQDADSAALTDAPPASALPNEGPRERRISPWPLPGRLLPPVSATAAQTCGRRFPGRRPASNWVSSYLPRTEFCAVLSRFRI